MRVVSRGLVGLFSAWLFANLAACSADSSEPGSTGSGSGAASGSGATTGSGGTPSSGSGVGGATTGAGGASSGAGGNATGTGGATTGAGGATGGSGSATGGAGGGGEALFSYTFDADEQGFIVLTGEGASTPAELQDTATATWTATGETGGGLSVVVPFDAASQSASVALAFAAPLDLTGKTITARVRLASGMTADGENPGGIMLFVKGGTDWKLAQTAWHNAGVADVGVWSTLTLTPSTAGAEDFFEEGFSVTDVKMVGITVATGGTGTTYEAATIEIDTITAQ